ncbi:MAG: hypothetical protein K2X27_26815 [Candidatus Obscuribacterales bacterium]|nr:hypothetical protein [Candidatus Obscuribacterales bacterium]
MSPENSDKDQVVPAQAAASEQSSSSQETEDAPPVTRVSELKGLFHVSDVIKKTALDHDAIKDFVEKNFADKKTKEEEKLKLKAPMPLKPRMTDDQYRKEFGCTADCESSDARAKIALCSQCKLYVYDFKDLELSEAQKMVLKQEDKSNPTLYRRKDGKFITAPCPLVAKKKRDRALLIVCVSIAFVLLAVLSLNNKPALTTVDSNPKQAEEQSSASNSETSAVSESASASDPVSEAKKAESEGGPVSTVEAADPQTGTATDTPADGTVVIDPSGDQSQPLNMPDGSRWKAKSEGIYSIDNPEALKGPAPLQSSSPVISTPPQKAKSAALPSSEQELRDLAGKAGVTEADIRSLLKGDSPLPQSNGNPSANDGKAQYHEQHGVKYYGQSK